MGGGSILFNSDSLVCLFVCPFIPYLEILHWVQVQFRFNFSFGSISVSVQFQFRFNFSFGCVVDKQPFYIRTATEIELIVC